MDAAASERVAAIGRMLAANGKPIEHATVLVYEAHTKNGYSVYCPTCWVDCGKRTMTDINGEYSLSGLNPDLVFKFSAKIGQILPEDNQRSSRSA